jgi:hypothetical protein
MNKLLLITLMMLLSVTISADEVREKPIHKGMFGVGAQPVFSASSNKKTATNITSISRLGLGVPIRYFPSKNIGIEANIGFISNVTKTTFGNSVTKRSTSGIDLGIGVIKPALLYAFNPKGNDRGHAIYLMPQVKGNFITGSAKTTSPVNPSPIDASGFQVGAFLGVEWFVTQLGVPQLSLQAAVGFAGITVTDIGGNEDQNTWALDPINPQPGALNFLNATLGFYYYFN